MEEFKSKLKQIGQSLWTLFKEKWSRFWELFWRNWKRFHLTKVGLLTILSIGLVMSIILTIQARQIPVMSLQVGLQETTTIIDDQGEEAGTLYAQKGTYIPIDEISPTVQHAVVSTEDQRFMKHIGFDLIGIGRAAVGYVLQGQIVGGGSTITQQLAKNAYLTADQTMVRKLKELFLAIEIEKAYSKDTILEMYLNNSYFGQGVWGVQDASKKYFNKNASELSVSEGAMIAGILQSPTNLNPIDHYEAAINRRNTVLMLMGETGAITAEQRAEASASDLYLADGFTSINGYYYPSYFDAVIAEAIDRYDFEEPDLLNGGYTIYTALNQNQQRQMDSVYAEDWRFETAADQKTIAQSASIAMNPQTGGVTAVVGGREYSARGNNRALSARRQPGSSIKPLGVYAPALEAGWDIDDILLDEKQSFGELENGEPYIPENWDFNYSGEIPMYEALAVSKNVATVWLLDEIGINRGYNKLKDFGLKVTEGDRKLGAVALGGFEKGATPLEMVSAYSVFANDGVRMEPHFITRIVDASGAVIVDNTNPKSRRVLSKTVNDDMNRMLLYTFANQSATSVQPAGYQVAGKTGTTETSAGFGATDQWIVGYTPDLAIASWMGYDYTNVEKGHYVDAFTAAGIGQVIKAEFERMLPYTEQTQFAVADSEIEILVKEGQQEDTLQRIEEGLNRAGDYLRDTTDKALRGARELFDKFRNSN